MIRKLKNFVLLEIAFPIMDAFMRTHTHRYFHEIKRMSQWSPEEVTAWQNQRLQQLISHFYTNTVYYKRLFDTLGLTPADIKTKEDLVKIPLITKDIINRHYEELIPKNIKAIPHKKATTGGSSGKTLKYFLDLKGWSYTTAIKIYSWQTCGYLYGDTFASIGSTSLFPQKPSLKHRFYHLFKNTVRINGMNLSDDKIEQHIEVLKKKQVRYLYGYAAGLFLIAKYVNQRGIRLDFIKGCFPTAEMCTPEYRLEMEKAFGYVMDCYGARDGSITAYEIHPGYYNVGYNAIAEVTDCYEKETGTLLVTDLLSYSFPFIRYDIGDDVTLPEDTSMYNYNGQVITKLMGRSPDIIRLSNGHVLTGPAFQLMFGRFNVTAYRIAKAGDLQLLVEIQPTQLFTPQEEEYLIQLLKNQAGEDCEIIIKKVAEFVPHKNGKRNYFMA